MRNWAGNQVWNPSSFIQPSSSEELKKIILKAIYTNIGIKVYGSKHSFSGINNTSDICINLDNYQGIIAVNGDLVTVKSGTKLYNLTKLLYDNDLAMLNMGDVDKQSIAGAISTGTHGTGISLGGMSTQVTAIKFINGVGEEVFCSEDDNVELFKCMQLSLGSFGIITEVTLRCVTNYKLELVKKAEDLDKVLSNLESINTSHRNFEFFWLPHTNKVQTKYCNITDLKEDKDTFANYFNDIIIENYALYSLLTLTKWFPSLSDKVSKLTAKFVSDSSTVKSCKDIYASPRLVRFMEMEYNIPLSAYKDCMKDITKLINSKKFDIAFPVENRFVQQDDIYMSPSYKRDSAYIACHVFRGKKYKPFFKGIEEIFSNYEGRPHWGKLHFKNTDYISSMYPMFEVFNSLRIKHDPNSLFMNTYLERILL